MDITDADSIALRRAQLLADKQQQEAALRQSSRELVAALDPVQMVKSSIHDLAQDTEVRTDVVKVGLSIGANFLISRLLGQPDTSQKALRNVLVQTIATTLINSKAPQMIDQAMGIIKLIEQQRKQEK